MALRDLPNNDKSCSGDAEKSHQGNMLRDRRYLIELITMLLSPFVGPAILYFHGVHSDLQELIAVICNPLVYLLLGMVVSSLNSYRYTKVKGDEKLVKAGAKLHDLKIASLLFLALFEAAAALIVLDGAPPTILVVAFVFYVVYAVLGFLWLKCLNEIRTHLETAK